MDAKTATKTAVAKVTTGRDVTVAKAEQDEFRKLLEMRLPQIAEASLAKLPPEYVVSTVMSAIRATPKLRECYPATVLHGVLQAVQFGLRVDPVAGEAYLIPRWNGKTGRLEANFQPGYRGLLKLVRRNKLIRDVAAQPVRENDEFSFSYGSSQELKHRFDPKLSISQRGKVVGYYAYSHLANGGFQFEYWDIERMTEHAKEYGGKKKGVLEGTWAEKFDEMARKTMIIQLTRLLPGDDPMVNNIVELDQLEHSGRPQEIDIVDGQLVHATIEVQQEEPEPVQKTEMFTKNEQPEKVNTDDSGIAVIQKAKEKIDPSRGEAAQIEQANLVMKILKTARETYDATMILAIRERMRQLYQQGKITMEDIGTVNKVLVANELFVREEALKHSKSPEEPLEKPVMDIESSPKKTTRKKVAKVVESAVSGEVFDRLASEIDKATKFTTLALSKSRIEKDETLNETQKTELLKKLIQKHNELAGAK